MVLQVVGNVCYQIAGLSRGSESTKPFSQPSSCTEAIWRSAKGASPMPNTSKGLPTRSRLLVATFCSQLSSHLGHHLLGEAPQAVRQLAVRLEEVVRVPSVDCPWIQNLEGCDAHSW